MSNRPPASWVSITSYPFRRHARVTRARPSHGPGLLSQAVDRHGRRGGRGCSDQSRLRQEWRRLMRLLACRDRLCESQALDGWRRLRSVAHPEWPGGSDTLPPDMEPGMLNPIPHPQRCLPRQAHRDDRPGPSDMSCPGRSIREFQAQVRPTASFGRNGHDAARLRSSPGRSSTTPLRTFRRVAARSDSPSPCCWEAGVPAYQDHSGPGILAKHTVAEAT